MPVHSNSAGTERAERGQGPCCRTSKGIKKYSDELPSQLVFLPKQHADLAAVLGVTLGNWVIFAAELLWQVNPSSGTLFQNNKNKIKQSVGIVV